MEIIIFLPGLTSWHVSTPHGFLYVKTHRRVQSGHDRFRGMPELSLESLPIPSASRSLRCLVTKTR
jgi:hypothetical protein